MSKPKILVTGGLGYIGAHTVVELLNEGFQVVIVDNLINSNLKVLDNIKEITQQEPYFYKIDINDSAKLQSVFKNENIDAVIHFAAHLLVDESVDNPLKYYRNNVVGLINVLECIQEYKVKNIVFSSSCTVYGNTTELPVTEESVVTSSNSPYGNTKIVGELMLKDFINSQTNCSGLSLRYFNPVGAHESGLIGELNMGSPKHLFPIIYKAIETGKEVKIFGDTYQTKDGTPVRDYIHVVDLAKAHVKSVEKLNSGGIKNYDYINVGTGTGCSVLEVIEVFEKELNKKINKRVLPKRKGDAEAIWADNTKASQKFDWGHTKTLKDMVNSLVKWERYQTKTSNGRK